jgi:glycine C-acetyltransferase
MPVSLPEPGGRARFHQRVAAQLADMADAGLLKQERTITSRQGPLVSIAGPEGSHELLNLCANNYLGLAGDPRIVEAAVEATCRHGAGLASVRFICGTQDLHLQLEAAIAGYLRREDAILFAAAFDANGGVFEPLLDEADAIVSDSLNHASIIDGVRLCKARRYRFANGDMDHLETQLKAARADGARTILIATDGVFSMDGYIAPLGRIAALADRYEALLMVDDCHATGLLGEGGRGTAALHGVESRVDLITGTFGKALGGAMGGFVAGRREVIALLRQRARPYLFSNSLAPAVCGAALAAIGIASSAEGDALRSRLAHNAGRFRTGLAAAGFQLLPGTHPIIPVMLHDASTASALASALDRDGIFVTAFSYPVVAKGAARIRTQMSAAHTDAMIDEAVAAFAHAAAGLGIVGRSSR